KQINLGDTFNLTGKWDAHLLQITVATYLKGTVDEDGNIEPIYSVKGNITINRLKNTIRQAIRQYSSDITEFLPAHYLEAYKLPDRKQALQTIQRLKNRVDLKY